MMFMSFNKIYQLNKTLILKKILLVIIVFTVIGRISYCHKHTSENCQKTLKIDCFFILLIFLLMAILTITLIWLY